MVNKSPFERDVSTDDEQQGKVEWRKTESKKRAIGTALSGLFTLETAQDLKKILDLIKIDYKILEENDEFEQWHLTDVYDDEQKEHDIKIAKLKFKKNAMVGEFYHSDPEWANKAKYAFYHLVAHSLFEYANELIKYDDDVYVRKFIDWATVVD